MDKIPKSVWVLAGLIAVIYVAWTTIYPSGTLRYKMTVVVETPEGIKTGSAVREVYIGRSPQLFGSTSSGKALLTKGEAVVVDLGQRGVLFALMRGASGSDYGHQIVFDAFPSPGSTEPLSSAGIRYYRSLKNAKVTLKPEQYPMFVRFREMKDPKTVESVYQAVPYDGRNDKGFYIGTAYHITDHFEETFGAGVKLKEVTIEVTDDSVMIGLVKLLPWLPEYYDKGLDGDLFGNFKAKNLLANFLSSGAFSTELSPHGR